MFSVRTLVFSVLLGIMALGSLAACQSLAELKPTRVAIAPTDIPTLTSTPTETPTDTPAPTEDLATATATATATLAPTARPVANTDSGPRSNALGFTPFGAGAASYISNCGSISAPGTYLLTNSVTSQWDCIQIFSDNVVFDCQGNSLNGLDGNGYGIVVHHTSPVFGRRVRNIEIRNCQMTNHRYGIYIDAAENLYIHDNNSSGNFTDTDKRNFGIFLGLAEGGGIRVNDTRGALVSNNRTDSSAIGVDVRQSDGVIVRGNSANGNTAWGIHFYGVIFSEVSSNASNGNIRYCTWGTGVVGPGCDAGGIMLQGGSSKNVVKNNTIAGGNGNGIFIKAHDEPCGDDNIIANNHISGTLYNAIELSFCKNNKLQGNEINNSMDGIWMGFTRSTEINAGNYLHDMTNHGIISWNSQENNVSSNRVVNSREALYFYSTDYKKDEFFFVPGEPSDHVSRGNCLCSNTLTNNSVAAIHLNNSIKNQLTRNIFANNGTNFLMEGNTSGNTIEGNNVQTYENSSLRTIQVLYNTARPVAWRVYDRRGSLLTQEQLRRALVTSAPDDSFALRWFKFKLRVSLGLAPVTTSDRPTFLGIPL